MVNGIYSQIIKRREHLFKIGDLEMHEDKIIFSLSRL